MKFNYTVHRANESTTSKTVLVNGEPIAASVPSVEVELTSDTQGTIAFSFVGSDAVAAKAQFVPGKAVTLTVE